MTVKRHKKLKRALIAGHDQEFMSLRGKLCLVCKGYRVHSTYLFKVSLCRCGRKGSSELVQVKAMRGKFSVARMLQRIGADA